MKFNFKKNPKPVVLDIPQIVHDLKNPLTTIIASVDFLKNSKTSEKDRKQFYDIIENESKNILDFINDILEISKIENGSQTAANTLEKCPVFHGSLPDDGKEEPREQFTAFKNRSCKSDTKHNIALITSKVLQDLKLFSEQKNIKIEINIQEDLGTNIPEIRIKQILSNLISNSIKYNKKNGEIIIKSYQKNNFLYIEVEDTGIGIPDDEQQKMFDKFYRCAEAKKLNIEGTGLGLSIVNDIVNAYGGDIKITSAVNKGSKFVISLPL
jgi:two-component system phosphate regulon sensor histidine kinase PhoR